MGRILAILARLFYPGMANWVAGGSQHGPGGFILTYVMPLAEVFDDISKRLGCSVHLPEA